MDKEKKSYHFNITEVQDGKIQEVMNFNFGGHHDLAVMVKKLVATGMFSDKHSKELVIGLRLLHHVAKKYPDNEIIKAFATALDAFKKSIKAKAGGGCGCSCEGK